MAEMDLSVEQAIEMLASSALDDVTGIARALACLATLISVPRSASEPTASTADTSDLETIAFEQIRILVNLDGLNVIHAVLRRHPKQAAIQANGLEVLAHIALGAPQQQPFLIAVVPTVLAALHSHRSHAALVCAALHVLSRLVWQPACQVKLQTITAVTAIKAAWHDHPSVTDSVLTLLAVLTTPSTFPALSLVSEVPVLVGLIESRAATEPCVQVLRNMSRDPLVQASLLAGEGGTVAGLIEALVFPWPSVAHLDLLLDTLVNVAWGDATNRLTTSRSLAVRITPFVMVRQQPVHIVVLCDG
jgi:hypothetical protein